MPQEKNNVSGNDNAVIESELLDEESNEGLDNLASKIKKAADDDEKKPGQKKAKPAAEEKKPAAKTLEPSDDEEPEDDETKTPALELTAAQKEKAKAFGIAEEELLTMGKDALALLDKAIVPKLEPEPEPKVPADKKKKEEEEEDLLVELGFTKEDRTNYEPEVVRVLEGLAKRNKELAERLDMVDSKEQQDQLKTESIWFDKQIKELGEEYEVFLGKGTIDEIDPKGAEFGRRLKLYKKMGSLLAGDKDLDAESAFQEALIIVSADMGKKRTTKKTAEEADKWSKSKIANPAQKQRGTKTKEEIDEEVQVTVKDKLEQLANLE